MNILITSPSLDSSRNISGISSVVRTIIADSTNTYHHFVLGRGDSEKRNIKWVLKQLRLPFSYLSFLSHNSVDLVHLNIPLEKMAMLRDLTIFHISRLCKKPVFLHVHGGYYLMNPCNSFFLRFAIRDALEKADVVVLLSPLEVDVLAKRYNITREMVALPNCVDIEAIKPVSKSNNENAMLNILFLGRIHESKGLDDIIKALAILRNNQQIMFTVCGTGPEEEKFVTACKTELGNRFVFKGIVSGKAKIDCLQHADVFLLPSKFEGFPIALLEAMSSGLVPITTDVGSMKYIIQDNYNGLLVKKQCPEEIAEKISLLLRDRSLLVRLRENARKTIVEKYSQHRYIEQINKLYNQIYRNRKTVFGGKIAF